MLGGCDPDPFYEQKIVKGLISPTWEYETESEMEATLNGRYRGDGRRLDQYIVDDPLNISLPDYTA